MTRYVKTRHLVYVRYATGMPQVDNSQNPPLLMSPAYDLCAQRFYYSHLVTIQPLPLPLGLPIMPMYNPSITPQ